MSKDKNSNEKPLIKLPLNVDLKDIKIQERKILEFNPNRIKSGEAIVVKVKKFAGLSEQCFAVANINGEIIVKCLKDK